MSCQLDISVWYEHDRIESFIFSFLNVDSDVVGRIMKNEYGFEIEWVGGMDFEFWKKFDNGYVIEGMCWGSIQDGRVVVVNADEWIIRAVIEKVLREVEGNV